MSKRLTLIYEWLYNIGDHPVRIKVTIGLPLYMWHSSTFECADWPPTFYWMALFKQKPPCTLPKLIDIRTMTRISFCKVIRPPIVTCQMTLTCIMSNNLQAICWMTSKHMEATKRHWHGHHDPLPQPLHKNYSTLPPRIYHYH